jgi:hypothetical protein
MLKLCTSSAQSLLPMASCQIVRGRQHGRHRVEIERPEPATFSGTRPPTGTSSIFWRSTLPPPVLRRRRSSGTFRSITRSSLPAERRHITFRGTQAPAYSRPGSRSMRRPGMPERRQRSGRTTILRYASPMPTVHRLSSPRSILRSSLPARSISGRLRSRAVPPV